MHKQSGSVKCSKRTVVLRVLRAHKENQPTLVGRLQGDETVGKGDLREEIGEV